MFDKEDGLIKLQPSPQQWIEEFTSLINYNVSEISFVACFQHEVIGASREEGRIRCFSPLDPYVDRTILRVTNLLKAIFKVPQALERLLQHYSRFLAIDIKSFKKEYKQNDYPIERYQDELRANQLAKEHVIKLMFEPRLQAGLCVVEGQAMRKMFLGRVEELNKVLFQCIKKKIEQTNSFIEQEVEDVLKVINNE